MMSVGHSFPASGPRQAQPQTVKPKVAVFFEESFPIEDGIVLDRQSLQQALQEFEVSFLTSDELHDQLTPERFDAYVHPYGSAFPKHAWTALLKYLRGRGNWINLGGIPFSVPVVRAEGEWRKEIRQTAYHKMLGITQSFPVPAASMARHAANPAIPGAASLAGELQVRETYELYVRFTASRDLPEEDGSAGPRDAVLRPCIYGYGSGGMRLAAPILQVDRLLGDFAGGRWMLANFSGSLTPTGIEALVGMAVQGAFEFVVRPSFACYREGEAPSFVAHVYRPAGDVSDIVKGECRIEIRDERQQLMDSRLVALQGGGIVATGRSDAVRTREQALPPGFYQAVGEVDLQPKTARAPFKTTHVAGFWVFDEALLAAGKPLEADGHSFLREGRPYPVCGTTYMASDVHRKFLLEPNPYVWMQDFAEMKAAGVNMVRTGLWTAWKQYMLDAGAANESALRALDAFLLTARRYDIPVILTLFAFLPEQWGGENPYLDPRSVSAQKELVAAIAQRYGKMNDLMWDYINEPSFCSPHHLWSCRPNYDRHEARAWKEWLANRFPAATEEERSSLFQERWRSTAADGLDLPRLEEFQDAHVFLDRRPLKVLDYRLFAQDMFSGWVKEMSTAVRSNGNPRQLVTVGQDEGGLGERPNPQFHAAEVDFTCMHTWWLNDDLLWDTVMAKSPRKPLVIEETGIMLYEKTDGSAWRTERDARNLLERKLALALGANASGVIQWIWNTNSYMASDNEAAIGFLRADSTAKPELEPFLECARFLKTSSRFMRAREPEKVVLIIPHSNMFSVRDNATAATKRCVRAMCYDCRTALRALSEYRIQNGPAPSQLLVLPSPRVLRQDTWESLLAAVSDGAALLCTGVVDSDEYWVPSARMAKLGLESAIKPVAQEEHLLIGSSSYRLSYRGEKMQRLEKAVIAGQETASVRTISHGKGKIIWAPIPVELSDDSEPTVALYKYALGEAGVKPVFTVRNDDPSVLVSSTVFAEAAMYTFVSECDRDTELGIVHRETRSEFSVRVPAQRAAVLVLDRKDGHVLGRLWGAQ